MIRCTFMDQSKFYTLIDRPTSADATVFAYLHVILCLPDEIAASSEAKTTEGFASKLRKLVLAHDSLAQYTRRLWTTWFAKKNSLSTYPKLT